MPIWSDILTELRPEQPESQPPYDNVRRKYLTKLSHHTGRDVILYASGWLQKADAPSELVTISDEDIQAFMEVSNGLSGKDLDLILHSPGGSLEAAEAVVSYLRSRFSPYSRDRSATRHVSGYHDCVCCRQARAREAFVSWPHRPTNIPLNSVGLTYGPCSDDPGSV